MRRFRSDTPGSKSSKSLDAPLAGAAARQESTACLVDETRGMSSISGSCQQAFGWHVGITQVACNSLIRDLALAYIQPGAQMLILGQCAPPSFIRNRYSMADGRVH